MVAIRLPRYHELEAVRSVGQAKQSFLKLGTGLITCLTGVKAQKICKFSAII